MQQIQGGSLTTVGGVPEDVVDIVFPTARWFVALSAVSMIDSLSDFDRDNAVAIDIANFDADPNTRDPWASGGDHWGDPGAFSNYHHPVGRHFGVGARFRLRSFHPGDLEAAGWGLLITDELLRRWITSVAVPMP